jgi:AcrR family transcriptional regulator
MSARRDEIAQAALDLIDEEGLEALTMRRLATRLGMGTMTLYGHFRDKDELLAAAIGRAGAEQAPERLEGPWQEQLRTLARGWHAGLVRHPALVRLRLQRPLTGPQLFRSTEAGLAALLDAGFDRAAAARAFRLLFLYVFGSAAFNDASGARDAIAQLPADEFPVVTSMPEELAATLGGNEQFEFGLDALIAGLEAMLAS